MVGAEIARPPAHLITLAQLALLIPISLGLLAVDKVVAYSVVSGGLVAIVPQAYFAVLAFRWRGAQSASAMARSSYAGVLGKFLLSIAGLLLLLEPDFGAMVVLMAASLAMMFLAGARLLQFMALMTFSATSMVALAYVSPYRWKRVVSFMDPWSDPFNSGFQLVQSLIAFGRGEAWGVGLGGSVQKLFYLPEAHTDFVLAVLAEELGLVGVLLVIALFMISMAGVAVAAEKQQTLSGTVIAIEAELGKVSVQDESGKMYTLSAGKGIDLKSLAAGDKVILKHSDGVIKALKKQG